MTEEKIQWDAMASDETIQKTAEALKNHGIDVIVVDSGKEALDKIMSLIPEGSEIANGSSTTLDQIGFVGYLMSGQHRWKNLHEEVINEKDPEKQGNLRRLSDAAEYFLGSVNAISQNGELVACDATGSRVSAYPFAAKKLVLVAGTQKIVPNLELAMQRVREYVYPLEDQRAFKAYGNHSTLGKWVIMEHEVIPNRTTLILVKEKLGF